MPYFFIRFFCENFAAFDNGRVSAWAEAGDAKLGKSVHSAQHQRIIRRDHGEIHRVLARKADNSVDVYRFDIHTLGVGGDAAVSGQRPDFTDLRTSFEGFDDGVLAPASAHDHDVHVFSSV